MVSLKHALLATFVSTSAVILMIFGFVTWSSLHQLVDEQRIFFEGHTAELVDQQLSNGLKAFEVLIDRTTEDLTKAAKYATRSKNLLSFFEKNQADALTHELAQIAKNLDLDFVTAIESSGMVLANFPAESDDRLLAGSYAASPVGDLMHEFLTNPDGVVNRTVVGFIRLNEHHVRQLGLPLLSPSAQHSGHIAIVVEIVVSNNFGEPIGIIVLGRRINSLLDNLQDLRNVTHVDIAVYAGIPPGGLSSSTTSLIPAATPLFSTVALLGTDFERLGFDAAIPKVACNELFDVSGLTIGSICASVSLQQITDAFNRFASTNDALVADSLLWIVLFALAGGALLMLASRIFSNYVSRPLMVTARAMRSTASGDSDVELPWKSRITEINIISDALRVFRRAAVERQHDQIALRKAKEEAERANQAKSQFLASMSHELRTPLNAVLGFSQALQYTSDEPLTEHQNEYLDLIQKSGDHLLQLINEILELARIESGHLDLSFECVNISEVVTKCIDMVKHTALSRGITLKTECEDTCPFYVDTDRLRFEQALLNLLSNAIKYNVDNGNVTLDCKPIGETAIRLTVTDTGVGIPFERQADLFEPFNRLGREAGNIDGSGIGLSITRQLVEALGGNIGFASIPGKGSAFWIQLPLVGSTMDQIRTRQCPGSRDTMGRLARLCESPAAEPVGDPTSPD